MTILTPLAGALALVVLSVLTLLLAAVEARRFAARGGRAHLYWSAGLGLVVVTILFEAVFYSGAWSELLAQSYLFLVAVLVGLLSLGSAELLLPARARPIYAGYVAVTCAIVGYFSLTQPVAPSILSDGVFTGNPSLAVILASSLVTLPAAAVMVIGSLRSAVKLRQWRLLYVTAGILVISAAGTLYIVSVPITLYFAEFVGVLLLFIGFGGLPARSAARSPAPSAAGGA
ncbi:MAG TPA: hypothetical protein VIZ68_07680 [Thermoplasmata archaeon]